MANSQTVGSLIVKLGLDVSDIPVRLSAAEKHLESAGTRMFFLGSRISAGVGAPLAAVVGMVGKYGLEFDKAMTESLAIMNSVSPQIRKQMETTAKTLVDTTKYSAAEGAEAYFNLASAGLDAAQMMGALPVTARFAQAGVMDLAKAAEYLTDAQTALGLKTEDAVQNTINMTRVSDVLTEANNRASGTVEQFAQALTNKVAGALRSHHKSVEEGVAVLTAYASAGIKGAGAGTQFWMMLRDLETKAIKNSAAFEALKVDVYDAGGTMNNLADILGDLEKALDGKTDKAKKATLAMLGFADRSQAAIVNVLGFSDSIREMQGHLENAGGATERVANAQMQAMSNQLLQLKNRFALIAVEIFASFKPVFDQYVFPLLNQAIALFKGLGTMLDSLSTDQKAFILLIAGIGIALGPVIFMLGSFSLAVKGLIMPIAALTRAWQAYQIATAASGVIAMAQAGQLTKTVQIVNNAGNVIASFGAKSAATAGNIGLMARAVGLLTNPYLLAAAAVTALAAGTYLYMNRATALEQAIDKNATAFKVETKAQEEALVTYQKLIEKKTLTKEETVELDRVTRLLAEASGLSRSAFDEEMKSGSALNGMLWEQVRARKQLAEDRKRDAIAELNDASKNVKTLESRLKSLQQNVPTVQMVGGIMKPVLPTGDDKIRALQSAEKEIAEAQARLKDAQDRVMYYSGMTPRGAKPMTRKPGFENKPQGTDDTVITLPESPSESYKKSVIELRKELAGMGTDDLPKLLDAWRGLDSAQQMSIPVLTRVWEKYAPMREFMDPSQFPADLENATGRSDAFGESLNRIAKFDAFSRVMSSTLDLTEAGKDFSLAQEEITGWYWKQIATGGDLNKFYRENESNFQDLLKDYKQLPPDIQQIVDRYLDWKAVMSQFSPEHQKAMAEASASIKKHWEDTNAMVADKSAERLLFSESYAGQELVGLKKGLAEKEKELERSYQKELEGLSLLKGEEYEIGLRRLQGIKENNRKILEDETRIGMLRIAQAVGVPERMIREEKKLTDAQLKELIIRYDAWKKHFKDINDQIDLMKSVGNLATSLGMEGLGQSFEVAANGASRFSAAADKFVKAETIYGEMAALVDMGVAIIDTLKQISQLGTRAERTVSAAMAGMQIGGTILPGWGHAIGFGIGAIAGLFMDDPGWKQIQNAVEDRWDASVSQALAEKIEADAKRMGSRLNAMLLHMSAIVEENGGFTPENNPEWASNLAGVFTRMNQTNRSPFTAAGRAGDPMLSAARAAEILDANFNNMIESGTGVNGLLNEQMMHLIYLEQHYRTGSQAIKDYVQAQLGIAAGGLGKVVGGIFGEMLDDAAAAEKHESEIVKLTDKKMKLEAQIADYNSKGVKNEKQRVAKLLAERDLINVNAQIAATHRKQEQREAEMAKLMSPEGQETFSRMERFATASFAAMIASGKSFLETLEILGPTLDTLAGATERFGFTASEAFTSLMGIRTWTQEFPEIAAQMQGLNEMIQGFHNSGYMTQQLFTDLGTQMVDTFNRATESGLGTDQALQLMAPSIQKLWELQQDFGYVVDESTQALIDQAEAAGLVGDRHRSAMDRVALAAERLVTIFETVFDTELGAAADRAAEHARRIEEGLGRIPSRVHTQYTFSGDGPKPGGGGGMGTYDEGDGTYTPPAYGSGAYVDSAHLAVVGDKPEYITPVDHIGQLAGEIARHMQRSGGEAADGGGTLVIKSYTDGRETASAVVPHLKAVLRKHGLI